MTKLVSVVNASGDWEENIVRLAKHLGQSKLRRVIFNVIYGRGSRAKSKKQIMTKARLKSPKAQLVQNELEHLQKHHLVVRLENDGTVDDGSRYVYGKENFVQANREAIVRRADNKSLADRTPTKRNFAVTLRVRPLRVSKSELRKRKKLSVLYLTASPDQRAPLRVDLEMKAVREEVRGSAYRDNIDLQFRSAADVDTILDGLNDHHPQIVHFSGHGDALGVSGDNNKIVDSDSVDISYELLAAALAATDTRPRVVVLNSCESSGAIKALLRVVPVVISMRESISDIAAIGFAKRFYAGLAGGQSVKSAFEQGVVAVTAASLNEKAVPQLSSRGLNPAKLVLT